MSNEKMKSNKKNTIYKDTPSALLTSQPECLAKELEQIKESQLTFNDPNLTHQDMAGYIYVLINQAHSIINNLLKGIEKSWVLENQLKFLKSKVDNVMHEDFKLNTELFHVTAQMRNNLDSIKIALSQEAKLVNYKHQEFSKLYLEPLEAFLLKAQEWCQRKEVADDDTSQYFCAF